MKLFWIFFLTLFHVITVNGNSNFPECKDIVQPLSSEKLFIENSPFPIQFIFVLRTHSPVARKQLELYHFINCFLPSVSDKLSSKLLILSPDKLKISTNVQVISSPVSQKLLSFNETTLNSFFKEESPFDDDYFKIESKTFLCSDFLKAVDYLFTHKSNLWEENAKNFILFNFNTNDSVSCKTMYEKYMSDKGSSTVGAFLNVIHVNSTFFQGAPDSDFKADQRYFDGYQLFIKSTHNLNHYRKYYGTFRYFTKRILEDSLNFSNYYYSYLSNTSLIHLNQEYFQENPESGKVSDMKLFVLAFIRLFTIGILIFIITVLSFCILATSLASLVVVLDSVDYQLGIIRNADIFNPPPSTTNPPVEVVPSNPKLAPQPPPFEEERTLSSSSVILCENLFVEDEMNSNPEMVEMELDETQSSTTCFSSFHGQKNNNKNL